MNPRKCGGIGRPTVPILIAVTLVVLAVSTCVPTDTAYGSDGLTSDHYIDGLSYQVTGDDSVSLVDCSDIVGDVVIPDLVEIEGKAHKVTSIGDRAFCYSVGIESLVIGSNVASIGVEAFVRCSWLTELSIPGSVRTIGVSAFEYCGNLTSLTLSDGLVTIGESAFRGCASIVGVTVPGTVTSVGKYAFQGCAGLADMTFDGNGLTSIGDYALMDCPSLTSIELPGSLSGNGAIGKGLLDSCTGLESIVFGEGIRAVGNGMLSELTALKEVRIPGSMETIGDHAFFNCVSLTMVEFAADMHLEHIGRSAFESCTSLGTIVLPGSLSSDSAFGDDIFRNCTGLRNVTLSEGIVIVRGGMFSDLGMLESVGLPSTLMRIDDHAFYGCGRLTSDSISFEGLNRLVSIGSQAFGNCKGLGPMVFPHSLVTIGHSAFMDCENITSITLNEGITDIGTYAFMGTGIQEATVPSTVRTIGDAPFAMCTSMTMIRVSSSNEHFVMHNGALFSSGLETLIQSPCRYVHPITGAIIKEFEVPESTETICKRAFAGSTLYVVSLGSNVTKVGYGAFSDCKSLVSVTWAPYATVMENSVFSNSDSLISVLIDHRMTRLTISPYALSDDVTALFISVTDEQSMEMYSDASMSIGIPLDRTVLSLAGSTVYFQWNRPIDPPSPIDPEAPAEGTGIDPMVLAVVVLAIIAAIVAFMVIRRR